MIVLVSTTVPGSRTLHEHESHRAGRRRSLLSGRPRRRGPRCWGADGGLERAASILDAFDDRHRELSLASLVRRTGLPRSTVHRTAERMIRLGCLDKPELHHRIGNHIFELSGLAAVRHDLREAVLPFMQDLYAATQTAVQLGVLEGGEVLVVDKITGHRRVRGLMGVGGNVPAHCSAMGRAMLAHCDEAVVAAVLAGPLAARTAATLTSPAAITKELAACRLRGWAVEREEGNVGVTCVAAPVFGPLGTVAAAISVTGPSTLLRPDRVGPAVRAAGAAASRAYRLRH